MLEMAKRYLRSRRQAYQTVLKTNEIDARIVLEDLAKFCRAHESTFHQDPRLHAMLEGRREVWLRIAQHLELSEDQLWDIYGNRSLPRE